MRLLHGKLALNVHHVKMSYRTEMCTAFWRGNLKVRDYCEELVTVGQ
jgi:hypothetical protein